MFWNQNLWFLSPGSIFCLKLPSLTLYLKIPPTPPTKSVQWTTFLICDKRGKETRTIITFTSNGSTFLRYLSLFMGFLGKSIVSYSRNWVNSLPINWKNHFPMCVVGLTKKNMISFRWSYFLHASPRPPTQSFVGAQAWLVVGFQHQTGAINFAPNHFAQPTARFYFHPTPPPPPVTRLNQVARGLHTSPCMHGKQMDNRWRKPTGPWESVLLSYLTWQVFTLYFVHILFKTNLEIYGYIF